MIIGPIIGEGKTKIIYEYPADKKLAILYFKDDITAGDGAKRDIIPGKGEIDWRTNKNIFERCLKPSLVPTHYISSPEKRYTIVKRMVKKANLEIVGRRVATGSYLDRHTGIKEGNYFQDLIVEFFYKDDYLHDPLLDINHIDIMTSKGKTDVYKRSKELLLATFLPLEAALTKFKYQLIDLKIEVGLIAGDEGKDHELVVVDDVTAGSLRVWPYLDGVDVLDTSQLNVLSQLNREGMLDKQVYREGGPLEKVKSLFKLFAEVTDRF